MHPPIYTNFNELFYQEPQEQRIAQYPAVLALAQQALTDAGMPPEMWSLIPNTDFIAASLLSTGYLPARIPLNIHLGITQLAPEEKRLLPKESVVNVNRIRGVFKLTYWCITRGESWWKCPHSFLADDLYKDVLADWYATASSGNGRQDLQDWVPKTKLSRSPADGREKEKKATKWNEWLAYCEQQREVKQAKHDAYTDALARVETLRLAWREEKALTWLEYQAANP